jgi:beta-lactamase class A
MGCNEKSIKIKRRFMLLALAMLLMLPALLCLAKYHGPRRGVYDADVVNKKAIQQELLPGDMDESKDDLLPVVGGNADISDNAEPDNAETDNTETDNAETDYRKNLIDDDTREFIHSLREYVSGLDGCYGIYFIDLNSGLEFGINENEVFYAASTVKVPLALYLGVLMENGVVRPDDVLEYTVDDYESGSGKIQYEEYGSRYAVRELVSLAIRISDNAATNMLIRMTEHHNLKDFMRSLGGEVVDDERNFTCPKDMAIYMKKAYEFSQVSDHGKELISELQNTVFNDRLPVRLPSHIKVAHKIGNWVDSYHDVGIVFTDNPYVISIMSKGASEKEAFSEIAHISKLVFDFFNQ